MLSHCRGPTGWLGRDAPGYRRRRGHLARGPPASTTSTGCASAGRPVGSHGRPGAAEDQRPRLLADEREAPLPRRRCRLHTSSPSSRSSAAASDRRIADEADLGDARAARRAVNAPVAPVSPSASMRDQLHDVAGRVVEVDTPSHPSSRSRTRRRPSPGRGVARRARGPTRAAPRSGRPARAGRRGRTASLQPARSSSTVSPTSTARPSSFDCASRSPSRSP